MQDISGDSTLEANEAFESDIMTKNIVPKHYHADIRRFKKNAFKQDCERKM